MRLILQILSALSLIALILPPILYLAGRMDLDTVKWLMLVVTIIWFIVATPWMWNKKGKEPDKEEVIM